MIVLLSGLALYTGLHLFTTALRPVRQGIVGRIGEVPWKILCAIGLVASVWLMVRGYGSASAEALWIAPHWMRAAVVVLMLPVLILYMGSYPGSAIRSRVHHPQLTGFKIWALLHLIVNGEIRAVVLFGGLLAWGIVEVILLNRRDGRPPLPAPADNALRAWASVPIGFVTWIGLLWLHPWLFGVDPLS